MHVQSWKTFMSTTENVLCARVIMENIHVNHGKRSMCTCNHGKHSSQPRKTFYVHVQSWKTCKSTTENVLCARATTGNMQVNHGKHSICTCNHGKHSCQPRKTFYLHLQSWKTFMSTTENVLCVVILRSYHRTGGGYNCYIYNWDTDLYWRYDVNISRSVHKVKCWQINGEFTSVTNSS